MKHIVYGVALYKRCGIVAVTGQHILFARPTVLKYYYIFIRTAFITTHNIAVPTSMTETVGLVSFNRQVL